MTNALKLCFVVLAAAGCSSSLWESREDVPLAPGVVHSHIITKDPFDIHILDVDLRQPSLEFVVYRTKGLVRASTLVENAEKEGLRAIAAVNGDFFSFKTGWPEGNQVTNGKFVSGSQSSRSHLLFTASQKPMIERLSFKSFAKNKYGAEFPILGVNKMFQGDTVSLITSNWYDSSGTGSGRSCIIMRRLSPAWRVEDTLFFVVTTKGFLGKEQMTNDQIALTVPQEMIERGMKTTINEGDTVKLFLGFGVSQGSVRQVLGGAGRILVNGVLPAQGEGQDEKLGHEFMERRHPRTFVGFDKDTTRLYVCTVDGRQKSSVGMTFSEMARFILDIGAWNALNLDGGGSTTFVVGGRVVNSPSDKSGERPVANVLIVGSRSP